MKSHRKSHRIYVDQGVAIFRRNRKWWIDIFAKGQRRRREPLGTENRDHALALARELAGEIVSRRWNIALARVQGRPL